LQQRDAQIGSYLQLAAASANGTGIEEALHGSFRNADGLTHVIDLGIVFAHAKWREPGFHSKQAAARCSLFDAAHFQEAHGQVLDANGSVVELQFPSHLVKCLLVPFLITICEEADVARQVPTCCGGLQFR
jgi:hypothetical protein